MTMPDTSLAVTLRDIATQFGPALHKLPSVPSVHKAQRALGVLVRALDSVIEEARQS